MILLQRLPLRFSGRYVLSRAQPVTLPKGRPRGQRHSSTQNQSSNEPPKPNAKGSAPNNGSNGSASKPDPSIPLPGSPPEPVDIPIQLWYHRLGPMSDFFAWFHRQQVKRPYRMQVATTLVTYLCGDLLAQDIGGEEYDGFRTCRMLLIGGLVSVPGYKWFLWLGSHFNYPSRMLSVAVKVVVNQAVFTPVFNSYFFGMQALMTGESPSGIINRIRTAVPTSMLNSLKLWPAVTAFQFLYVPAQYRFMFSGIFAVGWQAYLSFLNRRTEKVEESEDRFGHPAVNTRR